MTRKFLFRTVQTGVILASIQFSLSMMAQTAAPNTACSNATLQGTYTFVQQGSIVGAHGVLTPLAVTGVEVFDGNGHSHGFLTTVTVVNGQTTVSSDVPFTGAYTVNANCTAKETVTDANNNVAHFDEFVGPNGNQLIFNETDPGVVGAGTETRGQ